MSGGPDSCPKRPPNPPTTCNFGMSKSAIWGVSGAPVAVPMTGQNDPQTYSTFAMSAARTLPFWEPRKVPGGPGDGPGASGGVPGGDNGGLPGGLPGASRRAPGRLPGVSGSPWGVMGGPGRALGPSWGSPGGDWLPEAWGINTYDVQGSSYTEMTVASKSSFQPQGLKTGGGVAFSSPRA